jgi:hypothetical protein
VAELRDDFRILQGEELIRRYEAPLRDKPPAYSTSFCGRCGSPVPDPKSKDPWFAVHAGVLDDDPGLRPERHILVEAKSPWFPITDSLPQFDRPGIDALRSGMSSAP